MQMQPNGNGCPSSLDYECTRLCALAREGGCVNGYLPKVFTTDNDWTDGGEGIVSLVLPLNDSMMRCELEDEEVDECTDGVRLLSDEVRG